MGSPCGMVFALKVPGLGEFETSDLQPALILERNGKTHTCSVISAKRHTKEDMLELSETGHLRKLKRSRAS